MYFVASDLHSRFHCPARNPLHRRPVNYDNADTLHRERASKLTQMAYRSFRCLAAFYDNFIFLKLSLEGARQKGTLRLRKTYGNAPDRGRSRNARLRHHRTYQTPG